MIALNYHQGIQTDDSELAQQNALSENTSRILTPWNYLSISPAPVKSQPVPAHSSDSGLTLFDSPSLCSRITLNPSRTPSFIGSDSENFFQSTPFEKRFNVPVSPCWLPSPQEISPIVRSARSHIIIPMPDSLVYPASSPPSGYFYTLEEPAAFGHRDYQGGTHLDEVQGHRSQDAIIPMADELLYPAQAPDMGLEVDEHHKPAAQDDKPIDLEDNSNPFLRKLQSMVRTSSSGLPPTISDHTSFLRSPCKIVSGSVPTRPSPPELRTTGVLTSAEQGSSTVQIESSLVVSPLTPLTPLTSDTSFEPSLSPFRAPSLTMHPVSRKRGAVSSPATNRIKKIRLLITRRQSSYNAHANSAAPAITSELDSLVDSQSPSSSPRAPTLAVPKFSMRAFPESIKVSPKYLLFYRCYPISAYFQPPDHTSPLSLFKLRKPGGTYNPPRSVFDLYTPRFVKGIGANKVGLCPICIEPCERGGEGKKLWLAMKFSAFKCDHSNGMGLILLFASYHMQYNHGISAATGRPFPPPLAFRIVPRRNPLKKERTEIEHGKCQKCNKWVAVEGVREHESKVKELYWWKHAASCYQKTPYNEDQRDYFEKDECYKVLEKYNVGS